MMSTITDKTLDALHSIFAAYELSEQLVSDNGPQFILVRNLCIGPKWILGTIIEQTCKLMNTFGIVTQTSC